MNVEKNYYEILGINPNSSNDEIKRAYRKLALQWHPDKTKHPNATQKFKEISEAYQVLTNNFARIKYDMYRNTKVNKHVNDNFVYQNPFDLFDQHFKDLQNSFDRHDPFNNMHQNMFNMHNQIMKNFMNSDLFSVSIPENIQNSSNSFRSVSYSHTSNNGKTVSSSENTTSTSANGTVTKKTVRNIDKNGKKYKEIIEEKNGTRNIIRYYPDGTKTVLNDKKLKLTK